MEEDASTSARLLGLLMKPMSKENGNPKYYQEIIWLKLKTLTWAVVGHILIQSGSNSWELIPE